MCRGACGMCRTAKPLAMRMFGGSPMTVTVPDMLANQSGERPASRTSSVFGMTKKSNQWDKAEREKAAVPNQGLLPLWPFRSASRGFKIDPCSGQRPLCLFAAAPFVASFV